jgi:hypothetical protein
VTCRQRSVSATRSLHRLAGRTRTLAITRISGVAVLFTLTTALVVGTAPGTPAGAVVQGWTTQASYTAALGFTSLSCSSTSACVGVGATATGVGGDAATTSNSGTSWSTQLVAGVATLTGVSCVATTADCWASGTSPSGGGSVLASTDGGSTWTAQTLPAGTPRLNAISCPSTSVCFAVGAGNSGGVVVTTTNGGTSWSTQSVPNGVFQLSGVSCPTSLICFAVGGFFGGGGGNSATVIATTNGGTTWTMQSIPVGVNQLNGIACPGATDCFAVGQGNSGPAVIATTDGTTWSSQTLPAGLNNLNAVACGSTSDCTAVGQGPSAEIVATTDAGTTWNTQSAPMGIPQLSAVACPSTSDCFAAVPAFGGGTIIATTNSGGTWAIQPASTGGASGLAGISCPSTSDCFAAGQNVDNSGVVATTDGGSTWATQTLPMGVGGLNAISCPSTADCYGVGFANGGPGIVATTDGGTTWTLQTIPVGINILSKISCPTAAACFVLGASFTMSGVNNFVLATTDGGTTWTEQSLPAGSGTLFGISCPTAADCFAVGNAFGNFGNVATAVATTDGGTTWTVQTVPSSLSGLNAVSCATTTNCWAMGQVNSNGSTTPAVIATTDGSTWSTQILPSDVQGVSDLSCPTTTECVGTGQLTTNSDAAVYTVNGGTTWGTQSLPAGVTSSPGSQLGISCASSAACWATDTTASDFVIMNMTGAPPAIPLPYTPVTPTRICDTRAEGGGVAANQCNGFGAGAGTLVPGGGLTITVPDLPAGTTAVVLNVTVTNTTAPSFLTAWPEGTPRPNASNLNWVGGATNANLVEVALGSDNRVSFYNSSGNTDVIVDLEGYVAPAAAGTGLFNPLPPTRICDTRAEGTGVAANQCNNEGAGTGTLGPASSFNLQVTGQGSVPASGVAAVVLNVTVTNTTAPSFLTVWPKGATQPNASNLNWVAGETVPNRVIVPVGAGGQVSIYNSSGSTDVIVDVGGWFTDNSNAAATGDSYVALSPSRICDTRAAGPGVAANQCNGEGAAAGTLGPAGSTVVQVTGLASVPANAVAMVANVTVTGTTAPSFLTVWPDATARPNASDLNWVGGETVPNLVVVELGADGAVDAYNSAGSTDVIMDVEGYYAG